jgi:hypothetical protein
LAGGAHALLDEWLRQASPFTDKRKIVVEFYLYLASTLTVFRRLINRTRYR